MAKTKKFPKDMKMFDCTLTYRCPMIRKDSCYPNEIEDVVEVKLRADRYGYFVEALKEGYHNKFFYDLYLDWLLYTKYITIVQNP